MRRAARARAPTRSGCRCPRRPSRSTRSSQRTIVGQSSSSTAVSPYSSYSSHGTSTTASPQPAEPFSVREEAGALGDRHRRHVAERCRRPTGRRRGRAATSPRSRRRRRGTPRSARRAASRRSSPRARGCGQSVGMSQALPRKLHTAASCSRLIRSSLHANQPVRRRSVCTTTPVTSSAVERAGVALDPHVLEAVRGAPRLEDVARRRPAETTESTWPALQRLGQERHVRAQVLGGHVAVRAERLAVRQRDRRCRPGPRSVSRTQPLMFWPRSTTCTPASQPRDRHRAQLLDRPHRRGGRADQGVVPALARRTTRRAVEPGSSQPRSSRRSSRWPSIRSAAVMCDVAQRHVASVPTTVVVPSSCSRCELREERRLGRPTGRRRGACRPGRGTSRRRAARRARCCPGASSAVTS